MMDDIYFIRAIRFILGGTWYLYKMGIDTPPIGMFCLWSRDTPENFDMSFVQILDIEKYGAGNPIKRILRRLDTA